jgi:hypothetical protein
VSLELLFFHTFDIPIQTFRRLICAEIEVHM